VASRCGGARPSVCREGNGRVALMNKARLARCPYLDIEDDL
jgi:hypothetical protein